MTRARKFFGVRVGPDAAWYAAQTARVAMGRDPEPFTEGYAQAYADRARARTIEDWGLTDVSEMTCTRIEPTEQDPWQGWEFRINGVPTREPPSQPSVDRWEMPTHDEAVLEAEGDMSRHEAWTDADASET